MIERRDKKLAALQKQLTTSGKRKDRLIAEESEDSEQEVQELQEDMKSNTTEMYLAVSNKQLKPSNEGLVRMQTSKFMQSSLIRSLDRGIEMNMDIDSVAKFILYKVAYDYLANDFELCYNICSSNLSFVANCNLFEGNILRFKGLALEKIYMQHTKEYKEDKDD